MRTGWLSRVGGRSESGHVHCHDTINNGWIEPLLAIKSSCACNELGVRKKMKDTRTISPQHQQPRRESNANKLQLVEGCIDSFGHCIRSGEPLVFNLNSFSSESGSVTMLDPRTWRVGEEGGADVGRLGTLGPTPVLGRRARISLGYPKPNLNLSLDAHHPVSIATFIVTDSSLTFGWVHEWGRSATY